jgi:hypothetical protein
MCSQFGCGRIECYLYGDSLIAGTHRRTGRYSDQRQQRSEGFRICHRPGNSHLSFFYCNDIQCNNQSNGENHRHCRGQCCFGISNGYCSDGDSFGILLFTGGSFGERRRHLHGVTQCGGGPERHRCQTIQ